MTVSARTERNFRRARVTPGRRWRARRAFPWSAARRIVGVALLVLGIQQSAALAVTTPLLRVNQFAVHGNARLSRGQIHALLEDLRGANILRADLEASRRRLAESPWIAEVALRRVLPSTIEVFVSERQPMGLCRLGHDLYLVDERGILLDQFGPQYAEFDLPIIDGLVTAAGSTEWSIDVGRAGLAARVVAALGRDGDTAARLSEVDVTDPRNAVVLLENDAALLYLGTDRFLERVQAYLDLSSALRERAGELDYVDLRFERRVYVRPSPENARTRRQKPRAPLPRQF